MEPRAPCVHILLKQVLTWHTQLAASIHVCRCAQLQFAQYGCRKSVQLTQATGGFPPTRFW